MSRATHLAHRSAHARWRLAVHDRGSRHALARASRPTGPAIEAAATGASTGRASFYSGGRTASGGTVGAATCAHRWLPFGTRVLVTNLANLKRAVLIVNDRGPFVRGRLVDVSRGAAAVLGMLQAGVATVRVEVIGGRG